MGILKYDCFKSRNIQCSYDGQSSIARLLKVSGSRKALLRGPGCRFTESPKCDIDHKLWRHNAILGCDIITYHKIYTYNF